jgi:hypothetical protein
MTMDDDDDDDDDNDNDYDNSALMSLSTWHTDSRQNISYLQWHHWH